MPQIAQLAETWSSQFFWRAVFFGITFFLIGMGMVPKIMDTVVSFCKAHGIVEKAPVLGYGNAAKAPDADVRFYPTYIQKVSQGPAK